MTDAFDWEKLHQTVKPEDQPWFLGELDHDVAAELGRLDLRAGLVADIGAGPGTQAIALARRGFTVVGTDLSATAARLAGQRARGAGVPAVFLQDDFLETRLASQFDLIVDRGLLHIVEPARRGEYRRTVARLLAPRGVLLVKTFSAASGRADGLAPADLKAALEPELRVTDVRETEFRHVAGPGPQALFGVAIRGG